MRKLKLELDELAVQSFETAGEAEERGTVQARGGVTVLGDTDCGAWCSRVDTCGFTCYTCWDPSCEGATGCPTCYLPEC
jgi:hypothetical protein